MSAIRIDRFGGLAPLYNRRRLPAGQAQIAENVRFDSGDLRPLQASESFAAQPSADVGNLFYYRRGSNTKYIAFGSDMVVTAARSPVANDEHNRWYWCIAGEGAFAIADPLNPSPAGVASSTGVGAGFREFEGYRLGIPAPGGTVTATDQTGVAAVGFGTGNAITAVSSTNPATVQTASAHGFENGQRVRITIDPAYNAGPQPPPPSPDPNAPPSDGEASPTSGFEALDGVETTVAGVTETAFDLVGVNLSTVNIIGAMELGVLTIERVVADADKEDRAYIFTYVSIFGEEGPPSQPSNIVTTVAEDGVVSVDIADVGHSVNTQGGSRDNVSLIRVYRRVGGTQGGAWLFVGELGYGGAEPSDGLTWDSAPNSPDPSNGWSATFVDAVPSVGLGESLQSERWFPPPNGLEGMRMMPNGFLIGWKGNTLYTSEPNLPHAWNPDNTKVLDDEIVGAQSYGNTLVVGTYSRPYQVVGADPAALQARKTELDAPLLSPRNIIDAGTGVLFPTSDGLAWVGRSGARMLTDERYDRQTWLQAIAPRRQGVFHDERAIFFSPGVAPLLVDLNGGRPEFSYLPDADYGAAVSTDDELVVVVKNDATDRYGDYHTFNTGAALTTTWRSGLFAMTKPVNLAIGQVFADGYPVTVKVRRIDPTSYPQPVAGQPDLDDFTVQQYSVSGPEPFRMQADYMSREFEIEIQCNTRVQFATFATSLDELRQLP